MGITRRVDVMSDHTRPEVTRHCDVCVIGGSAAGLAATLQLGRQRRSVIVVDNGTPRNAPAAHMHSYLGREGVAPAEFTSIGREEVRSYGSEVLRGTVSTVTRGDDGRLTAYLESGDRIVARRIIAATGLTDELPEIDGLAEHWGRGVIHCPFCHGYEHRDERIVQIVTNPMVLHAGILFSRLTDRLTIVVHEADGVDDDRLDALQNAGVAVHRTPVARVVSDDGHISAVELADGTRLDADVVAAIPLFTPRIAPFASLGLQAAPHPSGLGDVVEVDAMARTAVQGLYAAGSLTDPTAQVLPSAADGSRVGAMVSSDLAEEDLANADRPNANADDWDRRYGDDRMWSGNPNGTLVQEAGALTPGRALDIGAGEGADALWLAQQGWTVTASDVSGRALSRVADDAGRQGLQVRCLHADANAQRPYESSAYDLVSAQYASIPRTRDHRGVHNILDAVAPGGTLVVVSHDLEPIREAARSDDHGHSFDPDAYERVDDFVSELGARDDWRIEVCADRPRPAGAITSAHHVNDVVLRARRVEP